MIINANTCTITLMHSMVCSEVKRLILIDCMFEMVEMSLKVKIKQEKQKEEQNKETKLQINRKKTTRQHDMMFLVRKPRSESPAGPSGAAPLTRAAIQRSE